MVLILAVLIGVLFIIARSLLTPSYDYYRFSFEFLGAVCLSRTCEADYLGNITDFEVNMHGFWPQKLNGSIDFCLYNSYDESKLVPDLLDQLNRNWVGSYNPSSGFRNHEWGKHGTCWAQQYYHNTTRFLRSDNYYELLNEYFGLVMQLKKEAALEDLFFPDRSTDRYEFTLESIQTLMQNRFNVNKVDVVCEDIDGEQYLTEARVCMDLDYNYTDCPVQYVQCNEGTVIVQAYRTGN